MQGKSICTSDIFFAVILSQTRRTEPLTAPQQGIRNITSPRVLNKKVEYMCQCPVPGRWQ